MRLSAPNRIACDSRRCRLQIVVRAMPGFIRVVALHLLDDVKRIRSKVFLVDDAVVADHERHHASDAILGGHDNQRKAADHRSLDHVVELAERRSGTLAFQNFEVVAVEWRPLVYVTLLKGFRYRLSDGASPTAVRVFPSQAIMLSGRTNYSLCVLIYSRVVVDLLRIFFLSIVVAATDVDGVQFVFSDAPVKNFITTGFRIETSMC